MSAVTSSSNADRMVTLMTTDGKGLRVAESLALHSDAIKHIIADCGADGPIPVQITFDVLANIVNFWEAHGDEDDDKQKVKEFDKEFVKKRSRDELFKLALAANFLADNVLSDVVCQAIADNIKNMSVGECREYMNVENDYTPEEEAAVREQHKWIHEEDEERRREAA